MALSSLLTLGPRPLHSFLASSSRRNARLFSTSPSRSSRSVCIVGSGPSGFYVAQHLLSKGPADLRIDLVEKLPVPFGLVRFGVAPDHPGNHSFSNFPQSEVKHVTNSFSRVAEHPRLRFLGNVALGKDVTLDELRGLYDAVVLAYGAAKDRKLGLEGEDDIKNVVSARALVGWYNGLPEHSSFDVDLTRTDKCVVVGMGNVALDVARILLTDVDDLRRTDITEKALSVLHESRIKHVTLVGRRGPLQVAFTIKELREMVKLKDCRAVLDKSLFESVESLAASLPRPRRRLTELLIKTAKEPSKSNGIVKRWELKLLRTPKALISDAENRIDALEVNINTMDSDTDSVVVTDDTEIIPCGLLIKSIGYQSIQVDPSVPFDEVRGLVPNIGGVVENQSGLFVSGWLATGPRGVIVDTMNDAFVTASKIIDFLSKEAPDSKSERGAKDNGQMLECFDLKSLLNERGVKCVDFVDWTKIDAEEQRMGTVYGKPREKITSVSQILEQLQQVSENTDSNRDSKNDDGSQ